MHDHRCVALDEQRQSQGVVLMVMGHREGGDRLVAQAADRVMKLFGEEPRRAGIDDQDRVFADDESHIGDVRRRCSAASLPVYPHRT